VPTYFFDTNIFIYAKGKDHPLKAPCVSAIRRVHAKEIAAIISTEIIQELLYRFQCTRNLPGGLALSREAMGICTRILPVTEADLSLALRLLERHPQLRTRDAFHSATMINNGIKEILTTDSHFDLIPEIRRIPPG
jgi:predicted nucleic acid-binding protein